MNSKKIIVLITLTIMIIVVIVMILIFSNSNNSNNSNINISYNSTITNNEKTNNRDLEEKTKYEKKYEVDMRSNAEKQAESLKYYYNHNKANNLEIIAVTNEAILELYLEDYKYNALNFPEDAYDSLDKEYREKKFGNLQEYKNYVNENRENIENIKLNKYAEYEKNNYKEYICIDQDGKYYIFNVNTPGDYNLILDTYTVDLPEFIDKYNKSNDQEKVILNIGKVISAINNDDFKYFYNKLADSFKNNYFENEDALKNYWLDNLYKKNKVEFMDFNREGNLYTYKLKITKQYEEGEESTFGKDAPSSFINIVMQLKEGTDFVMSFSVLEQ